MRFVPDFHSKPTKGSSSSPSQLSALISLEFDTDLYCKKLLNNHDYLRFYKDSHISVHVSQHVVHQETLPLAERADDR